MRAFWRPLVAAAAFHLIVAAAAPAQTVVVTKAPPGATVELVVNSTLAGTATADAEGRATFPLTPEARGGRTDADAYVFVEYCDNLRRVILVEPGMQGFPGGQCPRREVPGAFIVRQVTTLVVNVSEAAPSVLVRQGKAPANWLTDEVDRPRGEKPATAPSRGLYAFAAGGLGSYSNASLVACGQVECSGSTKPLSFSAGATFWLTPWFGIEGAYLKPGDVTLKGGSEGLYSFASSLTSDIILMGGKLGVPTSYVRFYGFGGLTWSRAHWDTLETIDEQKIVIDESEVVIPGGSQGFDIYTQGWSWMAGAGLEVPISKRGSLFSEVGRAGIKGDDRQGGEAKMNEHVLYIVAGIRIRIIG